MSWAVEEWKEGLSTRVLQKIQELESQVEKFKKERQQRQFQLESLEAALEKQKQKVEKEKNEGAALKRENQNLMELCDNLEKNRQKLFHELQVKESQINFQEGQLISSKKQVERLEQDLKRYKSELERQPKTFGSGDTSFDNTPQRSHTGSPTPIYNDSKIKELQRKSCKEIEERKHLEAEPKSMKSQKINPMHSERNISCREIARHQASSSVFSWQQEQTPSCPLSSHRETPHSNGSTKPQFPWESAATPSHNSIKLAKKEFISCSVSNSSQGSSITDQLKTQNQELRSRIQELENRLQIQAQDIKSNLMKLQDTQLQVENIKMELTEKEKTLNKARNEVTKITIQLDQTAAQLSAKEEKFRKLSNELNCQKQNFESVQCSLQQKIKDKDKEYQEILTTKQQLERNAKDCAQKLNQLEQAMQTMQLKENEWKENYEEVKKQNSLLSCQSAEQLQENSQLKEELCSTKLFLQQSQHFAEDLKNKNCSLEKELKLLEENLNKQDNSVTLEKTRLAVSDVEHEQDSLQQILKDKENIIEELSVNLENMETLQKTSVECEGLKKEFVILSQGKRKSKELLNELDLGKEELMSKIRSLESALMAEQLKHQEKGTAIKDEHERFSEQLTIFEQVVKEKTTELEAQRKAYSDLQQKTAMSEEKLQKERENNSVKLSEFTKEVDILQKRLQSAAKEALEKGKYIASLEASLASHTQLNAFLQKQVEELAQTRDEMERLAGTAEPSHQIFIQEMEQQISELQEAAFQKEGLLSKALLALEGKNKNLQKLIEESDRQQAEIQDLKESNALLKDLVQQLKVMGKKEPDVSTEISLEQGETEELQDESSRRKNTINILEEEILDIKQENQYPSKSFRERKESVLELSQGKQEKSLLLPEADEEAERKWTLVEPKEDYLESALRNQKVQKARFDTREKQLVNKWERLPNKLISLEKKKNTLFWQLEKNHSISKEATSLRQEGTGQNNRHSSVNILLQKLISEMKISEHAVLDFILDGTTLEQLRIFVEEREDELNKYQVQLELLRMDLEDREISIEIYADQVKHLEMILRTMEIKMEESEMEKEQLLHKLQACKDLQNSALKMTEISGSDQSRMCFSAVIKDNFNLQKDAKCSSVPHDLMPSQNDYLQLVSSLHMTMSKLNELEKMCEHLQKEESTLASQLKDSQLECIISTDTMTKELMEKMNRLKVETISVSNKLIDESKMEAQSDMEEVPLITPEDYEGFDYEHLKLINKEIKTQLNGIKEKVFSLKNEYEILDIQNLNMVFELSELESCNEMLKEKNTTLPINLNKAEVSFQIQTTPSSVNKEFKAHGKFCMESLCGTEIFPCTKVMLMEPDLDNDVSSTEMGGPHQNKQIDLEETPEQCNIAGKLYSSDAWAPLTKQVTILSRRHLKNGVKHFQCECCENSFKMLKESFRSHKILEGEEIEKIQELLLSAKKEVDGLQKQNIFGNEHWQQKLHKVILQVASELPAEKKLPQKQGELQNLDLSSHPIICADTDQAKLLQAAQAAEDQLSIENVCYMLQFQNLDRVMGDLVSEKEAAENQMKYLTEAREVSLREYEHLHSRLNISEAENAKISKSLEGSLAEKAELAARLTSAQEEADQLRQGIEKLKIKIESDERSRHHLAEKLKENRRKADTLTDKSEFLERELHMSEESLEDAILRMETAEAETEMMKTEIERMCVSQQHLEGEAKVFRLEKEALEKELKEKQDKVTSLEVTNSTLVNLLKENKKEKVQSRGECENAVRLMESQLKTVCEEIKLLYSEKETFKSKEQDLIREIASLKLDNMQLVGCLEEAKSSNSKEQQLVEAFIQELQSFKQKLNENDCILEPLLKNEALQAIQDDLQVPFKQTEEKLEVTPCEKYIFLGKVNSLNQMLQLKEEYDSFCHSLLLWLNYRMLKQEKAVMEKQIHELETQLKMTAPCFQVDVGAEEIRLELEELKESVEKTKEAHHNLEKHCTLIMNHDKLEEENEMLRTQVSLLNTCLKQLLNDTSSSLRSSQSPVEINSGLLNEKAIVPKIIKKGEKGEENRSNEYGCPCISPQTSLEPRMDSHLFSPSLKSPTFIDKSQIPEKSCFFENLKTTAEGSRLQKMNFATDPVGSSSQDFTPRSPLSSCNLSSQEVARRSADHLDMRYSPRTEENELDKACHVQ
ncbi:centromere protein F [Candoia aspera]|uniref:centromere protein F n=1 Tax=Candoia aspera TaxID=51853 RepID=UPI002FD8777C